MWLDSIVRKIKVILCERQNSFMEVREFIIWNLAGKRLNR